MDKSQAKWWVQIYAGFLCELCALCGEISFSYKRLHNTNLSD